MQSYSVCVPCKSYIRKYFEAAFGNPIELKLSDELGDIILTKMANRPLTRLSNDVMAIAFQHFDDSLKFILPMDFFFRVDHQLTNQQIYSINQFLESIFETDLILAIHFASLFGVERRHTIDVFIRRYNIIPDVDITVSSLEKKHYRFRTKKKNSMRYNFMVSLSSPFDFKIRSQFDMK